ncbi:MAG: hypothetical protein FJ109_08135 [Deltaproteobacteria bacterium]|nr:hypothetical protein [Deltaproteobacteria bacterium]
MPVLLLSVLLLVSQPVADPLYFSKNSPECVLDRLAQGNPLPLIVVTEFPACPWNADDLAQVEIGRSYSHYSWWNFERTANLEIAATRLDGTILLPGEVFSYNEAVGERTEDRGFKESKVIGETGYIDGVGGGICQPASMLYAASLMAGLEIEERHSHRFRVPYMHVGLDATVDWGKKDLKIRNNTDFPVIFHLGQIDRGEFLVRVMAPVRTFRVHYKYELVKEVPSDSVQYEVDPQNRDLVHYYGRPGIEIAKTIWRKDIRDGKTRKVKVPNDEYWPSPWVLRVPSFPGGKKFRSGLSQGDIAGLLKGSKYTVRMARFADVDRDNREYIPIPHVPAKRLARFTRFSELPAKQEPAATTEVAKGTTAAGLAVQ